MKRSTDFVSLWSQNYPSSDKAGDPTALPMIVCLILGAVVAAYAAAVSIPDPSALVGAMALP
jgi:hypothetical protein